MLVIRLARTGRSKYPTYRIVAAESARAATGRFVEILGHYNPHTKELVIKREQVQQRLSHGAQPSNTVVKLLQRDGGIELPAWVKLKTKAPKVDPSAAAVTAEEASTEETSDVTEEEAAADAEGMPEAPAETDADEAPAAEEPTTEDEGPRVAAIAEEVATEAATSAPNVNNTETDESNIRLADATLDGEDKAAKAATGK